MLFPEITRVIYEKNPLVQVICQLRFPTILRIDSEPVEFQERIRQVYPLFRQRSEGQDIPQDVMQQLPSAFAEMFSAGKPIYDFISADEQWTVSLNRGFVALTARDYKRWEDFREHLKTVVDALVEIYSPAFYTRVGLRYQNIIQMAELDIEDVEWSDLLNPYIAGELASPDLARSIQDAVRITLVRMQDGRGQVRIRHGLMKDKTAINYLIDNDLFTDQRTEIKDALGTLNYFNRQNGKLFRWCITDRLHAAMGPGSV